MLRLRLRLRILLNRLHVEAYELFWSRCEELAEHFEGRLAQRDLYVDVDANWFHFYEY